MRRVKAPHWDRDRARASRNNSININDYVHLMLVPNILEIYLSCAVLAS
jgi:hypothetical protein